MSDLEMLKAGIYRKIGRQRKRTLRKRGEFVWFSPELGHHVWEPEWHTWNPNTPDGLPWVSHKEFNRLTLLGIDI